MTTEPQADIVERLARTIPVVDGTGHVVDGLVNRDGREAAAEITRLRAELAEARIHGRRKGLDAAQEVLGRVAYAIIEGSAGTMAADHAREFVTANWKDAVRSARNVLTELRAIDPATLLKDADHG